MSYEGTGPLLITNSPYPNVLFSEDYHTSLNGDALIRFVDYDTGALKVEYIKAGTPGALDLPWPQDDNNPPIHRAAADAVTAA